MIRRIAIYYRVSTSDQRPDAQVHELRDYAKKRRFEIVGEYVDTASGAAKSRPELDRMLADVRKRKADVVLVWAFADLRGPRGNSLIRLRSSPNWG